MLKNKKIPHTYVIIFYIVLIAAVATWFVPGGQYVKETVIVDGKEKEQVVYETVKINGEDVLQPKFEYVDNEFQTWQVFAAMFKGFEKQAGIIVFILMVGGAFWIMNQSKAIDVGIFAFLNYTKKLEKVKFLRFLGVNNIVLTMIMIMFSIFGAVFGMSEETIAFIVILVPLAISMGYDSITGVAIVFVAAGLGFAGAILNPFTIGIAQGIAELPLFSGIEYRIVTWFIINFIGITFILRYANKVKKNPKKSLVYETDQYWRDKSGDKTEQIKYYTPKRAWVVYIFILVSLILFSVEFYSTEMKIGNSVFVAPMLPIATGLFALTGILSLRKSVHFFILNLLAFTIVFLIIGVMGYGWYIMKIATLFLAMGLLTGVAMKYNPNEITKHFLDGAKDIMSAALVVGLAGGIVIILQEGKIIDTILHSMAEGMKGFGKIVSVGIMYVIQTFINIVIPSGSAKAAITMPIMAPFSDYIGISRQATVVAFQFGDGFTNMITPTSGVLIGVLGVAKIPYDKWVKWITPFMIILIILGFLLLIPTVTMDLNGF
ncbi:MAG: AbgT family transporter [Bacteroidales bacterium]|nr:AbgT family transporter [Bacteroidales bacterium]